MRRLLHQKKSDSGDTKDMAITFLGQEVANVVVASLLNEIYTSSKTPSWRLPAQYARSEISDQFVIVGV